MSANDERDTIFSRMALETGTERFRKYYQRRPEKRDIDDVFRSVKQELYIDRVLEKQFVDQTFELIAELRPLVRGPVATTRTEIDPAETIAFLKRNAVGLGAVLSGVTKSHSHFFYSIRGRGARYGQAVDDIPPRTFVMAFEMDRVEVETAPDPRESAEVVRTYLTAATAALSAARFIRSLGWDAVAHMDGETEVIMPLAAAAAGMGQLGRHGLLLTRDFGSRVRLSAVTTDLPLPLDGNNKTVHVKAAEFCTSCGLCAKKCPGRAIDMRNPIDGRYAVVDHEACFSMWKHFGTDCGVCLAVCPYR